MVERVCGGGMCGGGMCGGEGVWWRGCVVERDVWWRGMCGGEGMWWRGMEVTTLLLQKICADPEAHRRVLRSYEMMLDFYGMKLKDLQTGL